MKLRTKVKMPSPKVRIQYSDQICSIGSCFSVHMSDRLSHLGYPVNSNPTGITFNPQSILRTIKIVLKPDSLQGDALLLQNGVYSHLDFHSSYSQMDAPSFIAQASNSLKVAAKSLQKAQFFIITLGTCHVHRYKKTNEIVNNCHKLPSDQFTQELMTLNQVIASLEETRALVLPQTENKPQFIFTVSPVRHIKNGLVEDRKSKSTALLAVHHMVDRFADCHYFPSYEIMTDDLRDYRYYNDDLIHPSQLAVEHIFNEFTQSWLAPEDESLRARIEHIQKRRQHRPLFPDTEAHKDFEKKLNEDMKGLVEDYPFLSQTLGLSD